MRSRKGPPGRARASRSRHVVVRWVFLRALGGVYLVAFRSLGEQVLGLYGRRGIAPASALLSAVRRSVPGRERYRQLPTLLWLDDSDAALVGLCKVGRAASVALALGLWPRLSALTLWASYLSLLTVGQEFLSFQWDVLLLESGLLAVAIAPRGVAPRWREEPPGVAAPLLRWLVFRLYLESGVAKLQSGDPTWRDLSAMRHYWETEPLPNRGGWWAHHLPASLQRFSSAATIGLECVVPFLALGPRPARRLAFWLFSGLQGAIALTGNYGFFNLLSAVVGVWLLDDADLPRALRPRPARTSPLRRFARALAAAAVGAPLLALSAAELTRRFARGRRFVGTHPRLSRALARLEDATLPFHLVSPYGLFAVMTTRRPEVAVEGSDDGVTWREYAFRYKVGDPSNPPRQVAPHQPRLDWQMWFAALGPPPPWFLAFLARLLQGAPEVLGLLAENPFPARPPRWVRALAYDYRMASAETRRRTGAWWERALIGLYVPPVSLARAPPPGAGVWSGPAWA